MCVNGTEIHANSLLTLFHLSKNIVRLKCLLNFNPFSVKGEFD